MTRKLQPEGLPVTTWLNRPKSEIVPELGCMTAIRNFKQTVRKTALAALGQNRPWDG
jgi:hypothetical protein